MSSHLKEFKFNKPPKNIIYLDDEPLKLTEEFTFFHNKSKLRKALTPVQYTFKSYLKNPLLATGIRDSYLNEEFTEEYLIVLFTTSNIVKEINKILEKHSEVQLNKGCFYLATSSSYMILLAKDMDGFKSGINIMEEILTQVLQDYFNKKIFEDYIKVQPFQLSNCIKSY